jgi:hypothetical protein
VVYSVSIKHNTNLPSSDFYDSWSTPEPLESGGFISLLQSPSSTTRGTARTINIVDGVTDIDTFANYQGTYCRIYMIVNCTQGSGTDEFKMKGVVYRTSRTVGNSTIPPPTPIK